MCETVSSQPFSTVAAASFWAHCVASLTACAASIAFTFIAHLLGYSFSHRGRPQLLRRPIAVVCCTATQTPGRRRTGLRQGKFVRRTKKYPNGKPSRRRNSYL